MTKSVVLDLRLFKALTKRTHKWSQIAASWSCTGTCFGWPNRLASFLASTYKSPKNHFKALEAVFHWLIDFYAFFFLWPQSGLSFSAIRRLATSTFLSCETLLLWEKLASFWFNSVLLQIVKGYTRKGGALFAMKRFTDAQKTYQKALELDPANKVKAYF